jgi:hypothetical protein
MRALGNARRDTRKQNYDAISGALSLPLPRDLGTDPALRLLFRPSGDEMGGISGIASIRNMASALNAFTAGFYRANNNTSAVRPRLSRDAFGPYWVFSTTSDRLEPAGGGFPTTAIPWQTAAGHVPGTIAAVFMVTTAVTAEEYLFFIGGNTGSSCGIGVGLGNGSVATGKIFTRTSRIVSTSAITLYQPHAAIFTSRSRTDHEVVCRNLITGAVLSNTSALDSGALGGLPVSIDFGNQAGLVGFFTKGRIYLGAFWDRAFTRPEQDAWLEAPMAFMQPRLPGFRFDGAATASVRGMRVRILG